MSKTVVVLGAVLICLGFVASSAKADSIRFCNSEVAAGGHSASCGAVSGPSANFDSVRSAESFSVFSTFSTESVSQRESLSRLEPSSGIEDRGVSDIFSGGGLGKLPGNETKIHGIGRIFDPEPLAPVRSVASSTVPVPEPSSLPLAAMGLTGIALFGASFRRKGPLPPGTV
jgi:hypothetical protein